MWHDSTLYEMFLNHQVLFSLMREQASHTGKEIVARY